MSTSKRSTLVRGIALAALFAAGAAASALAFPGVGSSRPAICPNPPCADPDPTTRSTTTTTSTTTQNRPPGVSSSAVPNPATVGVPLSFSGAGIDPDGDTLTYRWAFGDGATASGAYASHSYGSPGTYVARFTARDPVGNETSSTHYIVVNAAPTSSTTTTTTTATTTTTTPVTTNAATTTTAAGTTTTTGATTSTTAPGVTTTTTATSGGTQPPPGKCFVPSVKGKTLAVAAKSLKSRSCTLGKVTRVRSKLAKNRVVTQKPKAGSLLPQGTRVNLVVSRGRR